MKVSHSDFFHHIMVNTYARASYEFFDGVHILSIHWGVSGFVVYTEFRSVRSLRKFVDSLVDGRAKRVFKSRLFW